MPSLRKEIRRLSDRLDEFEERLDAIDPEDEAEEDEAEDEDEEAEESGAFTEDDRAGLHATAQFVREFAAKGSTALGMSERLTAIERKLHDVAGHTSRAQGFESRIEALLRAPADRLDKCAAKVEEMTRALAGQLNLRARIAARVRTIQGIENAVANRIADAIENPSFGDDVTSPDLGSFKR